MNQNTEQNTENGLKPEASNYTLTAQDVDKALAAARSEICRKAEFCAMLGERGLAGLEVKNQIVPDFTTTATDIFLDFLNAAQIPSVMYHYEYYDEAHLDAVCRIQDPSLFLRRPVGIRNIYTGQQPEESDYTDYVKYTDYLKKHFDAELPRELWLYAVYHSHMFACRIEDDWLMRTGLPTAQMLVQAAANIRQYGDYGKGIIGFRFADPDAPAEEQPAKKQPAAAAQAEQEDDPDAEYNRILRNIERNRYGG